MLNLVCIYHSKDSYSLQDVVEHVKGLSGMRTVKDINGLTFSVEHIVYIMWGKIIIDLWTVSMNHKCRFNVDGYVIHIYNSMLPIFGLVIS